MANYSFEDFESYYGGTPASMLREYAQTEDDIDRKEMFLKLAQKKESGISYQASTDGGKLHYIEEVSK